MIVFFFFLEYTIRETRESPLVFVFVEKYSYLYEKTRCLPAHVRERVRACGVVCAGHIPPLSLCLSFYNLCNLLLTLLLYTLSLTFINYTSNPSFPSINPVIILSFYIYILFCSATSSRCVPSSSTVCPAVLESFFFIQLIKISSQFSAGFVLEISSRVNSARGDNQIFFLLLLLLLPLKKKKLALLTRRCEKGAPRVLANASVRTSCDGIYIVVCLLACGYE